MIEILMVVLGSVSYHCLVMVEMQQAKGRIVWPVEYVTSRPIKTLVSIIGAVMGYLLCTVIPEDTHDGIVLTAYATAGFSPYHVFDVISKGKYAEPEKTSEGIKEILLKQGKFKASDPTTYIKAFIRSD